jgi:hypothetical protein
MRSRLPRVGIRLEKPTCLASCGGLLNKRNLDCEPLSCCASCSVVWGFGFRRTGLWARPRPGALGGALVKPEKSGPGLCFLPRNSPGWPWNPAY